MPLRTQIKAIAESLPGSKTFLFGTAKEINVDADNTNVDLFVCMYPMQPVAVELQVNGSAGNTFDLYLEFLYITKFEKDTEDNEPLINQALQAINKFMVLMRDYKEGATTYFNMKDVTGRAYPIYNQFDANTCGMSLTIKVKKRQDEYLLDC